MTGTNVTRFIAIFFAQIWVGHAWEKNRIDVVGFFMDEWGMWTVDRCRLKVISHAVRVKRELFLDSGCLL